MKEIPKEVTDAAIIIENYFKKEGVKHWKLMGVASRDMVESLEEDSLKLTCLENAGVDNWQGIDYAYELMRAAIEE